MTKRLIYASAGVRECWVVEPAGLVERWTGRRFERGERLATKIVTQLLPGFSLDLRQLFAVKKT